MSFTGVTEAQLNQHAFELLSIHEALLRDAPRNRAFHQALASRVTAGCTVLDIGSGTGLWAILAAKLGAARVVAVEKDALMCAIIRRMAIENGVADRVRVVEGMSHAVNLDERFDVVISETIGHMVFDEDIVEIMADARARFLKPGGFLIPERVALVAAPLNLNESRDPLPAGLQAWYQSFEKLVMHRPLAYLDKSKFEWLASKTELVSADLHEATQRPDVTSLQTAWTIPDASRVDGVACWVELDLAPGIKLSTLDTPSWSVTVYRNTPFDAVAGELQFTLELQPYTNVWTFEFEGERRQFSPSLAATQMVTQHQVDTQVLQQLLSRVGGNVELAAQVQSVGGDVAA